MKKGPYIKSNNTLLKMDKTLLFALSFLIVFAFLKNGFIPYINGNTDIIGLIYPLIFIFIGVLVSSVTEFCYDVLILKEKKFIDFLKNSRCHIYGLLLTLMLPLNLSLNLLALSVFIGVLVGKKIFGGIGFNVFNPAILGFIIILTFFNTSFTSESYLNASETSIYTSLPITSMQSSENINYSDAVYQYGSLNDFILGYVPGSMGTTSIILIIAGFLILLFKSIKWRITLSYLLTVFFTTYLIGEVSGIGLWLPLFILCTGAVMFTAVYLAPDNSTSPTTPIGQILYGAFIGFITIILIFILNCPYAAFVSVLIGNMLVPFFDKVGYESRFDFMKAISFFTLSLILLIVISIMISLYKGGA